MRDHEGAHYEKELFHLLLKGDVIWPDAHACERHAQAIQQCITQWYVRG